MKNNVKDKYLDKMLDGDRQALAKIITLTESKLEHHRMELQEILEKILPYTGKSLRIGISGPPGVGKSTFIDAFGLLLVERGKRVAVLTVDPSSPVHGGSILGDKTRMEELLKSENAFIRPSPSSGSLGGVAQRTREEILLCEAAGHDVILVETVGVGQSEVEVSTMVDFFMVLMLPNAGDELQGIKKGILELADAIVVNKADGESVEMAKHTMHTLKNAVHMLSHPAFWVPPVKTCSAIKRENIDDIWEMVLDFFQQSREKGPFESRRRDQNKQWMWKLIWELLEIKLKENEDIGRNISRLENKVIQGEVTPLFAAREIVSKL